MVFTNKIRGLYRVSKDLQQVKTVSISNKMFDQVQGNQVIVYNYTIDHDVIDLRAILRKNLENKPNKICFNI